MIFLKKIVKIYKENFNKENLLFPGRLNYKGPTEGYFGLLHHDTLFEYSANVLERVEYVKEEKPADEVLIRLHNMIYLPFINGTWWENYKNRNKQFTEKYKTATYNWKKKQKELGAGVLAFIKQHIPDCAWDEDENELKF
jgi:hypothetical protein